MKFLALLFIFLVQFIFISPPKAYAFSNPATVPLGTSANFAALAKTLISSPTGPTVLNNGDFGIDSPGTCTGFPSPCTASGNGTINSGAIQYQNAAALQGQTDATAAVTNIGLRAANQTLSAQLGGQTLTQGVYEVPAAATNLTGDLTLNGDANSVFIFHLTSTLITDSGSRVLLTGGAQACNVFWKVDSSATFNGTTQMVGTVLASASITFPGGGATLNGRAIAQTAAITFNNTTVNKSSCAGAASSTFISSKLSAYGLVLSGSGPTSVRDTATVWKLPGRVLPPTGVVDFSVCKASGPAPSDCARQNLTHVGGPVPLVTGPIPPGNSLATSDSFTPTTSGNYCFKVVYTPDQLALQRGYTPASLIDPRDECFVVTDTPTQQRLQTPMLLITNPNEPSSTTTFVFPGPVILGQSVSDSAVLTAGPGWPTPTGTVDFKVCIASNGPPSQCALNHMTHINGPVTLVDGKAVANPITPQRVGTYCFKVDYVPDTQAIMNGYISASLIDPRDECFTVVSGEQTEPR